jgi:hypothetical protein
MLSAVDLARDFQGKLDVEKCRAKWVELISMQLSLQLYVCCKITMHIIQDRKRFSSPSVITLE